MKKNQLIELVRNNLVKIDKVNILHPEIVSKYITIAMNQILYDTFRRVPDELDLMSKEYDLTVSGGQAELPVSVYQLPGYAQVRRLVLPQDYTFTIVPEPLNATVLYSHLDVGKISTVPSFSITGDLMLFNNLPSAITSLSAWLIPTFDSLDEDDEVYIPSGKSIDLYTIVSQIAGNSQPPNLLNQ